MEKLGTLGTYGIFLNAQKELEAHRKPGCTLIVHPSVVAYDYRIAWTWEEMDNRNKSNNIKDKLRLACGMPARPYGRPIYSEWATHYGKQRPLLGNFGSGKTDLIPDWW